MASTSGRSRHFWTPASRRVDHRDLKGIDAFADRAGKVARRIIVYLGPRRQQIEAVEAVPLEEFLAELPT